MRILVLSLLIIFQIACKNQKSTESPAETKSEETTTEVKFFGEEFEVKDIMSYENLLKEISVKDSLTDVVVKGTVDGVCQVKGCWMNIVNAADTTTEEMFVKFKDYGFFMPLDLTGDVIMKGNAYYEETSVEELQHYAEDEGKSTEEIAAITEPIRELKFMASGVTVSK